MCRGIFFSKGACLVNGRDCVMFNQTFSHGALREIPRWKNKKSTLLDHLMCKEHVEFRIIISQKETFLESVLSV